MADETTPQVTKRKVTMTSVRLQGQDENGDDILARFEAVDYVPDDDRGLLAPYIADAQTKWDSVTVSDEYDAGPLGYHGPTSVPQALSHPMAGQVFEATYPAGQEPDLSPPDDDGTGGTVIDRDGTKLVGGGGSGAGKASAFMAWMGTQGILLGFALTLAALINTAAMRAELAIRYGAVAAYGALYSTVPAGAAGTELTGGSPAYARLPLTWSSNGTGTVTASATFNVASGSTVAGAGVHSTVTAGVYYDGAGVTSQAFASQGTYALTLTYTQT